jgi:FdhD protein
MADKIVSGRNEQVTNFHPIHATIEAASIHMKESGIGSHKIIRRKRDGDLEYLPDELTIEEPLEIRVGGKSVAVTMRTPGHDEELAAGFVLSEAIVRGRDQIAIITPSTDNRIIVELATKVKVKLNSTKRFGTISSSCGLCGKTSIDAIRQDFPAIRSTKIRVNIETLLSLPEKLRNAQSDFARTGGIHAAGIFDMNGELKIAREDVGRHNAVDKAIGRAFLDHQLPLRRQILLVSGRASFEIMQKALAASVPIVASVSAPSSLAVEFARKSNQTLVGFLRPPSFNIYSHIERVILDR